MNEQVGKKRDWIKNATIVFLIIMLLLTFFSNTIMNYSLPEVSAEYVNSGTIQAKVRGNGTVNAGDPYTVTAESNRTIESVAVRNGDHVEKGQVLFYLKEGESTELKEAQKLLDQLLDSYRQSALAANMDTEATDKILNGQFTTYNTYKSQIDAIKKEIEVIDADIASCQAGIDEVKANKKDVEYETSDTSAEKRQAYEACVRARESAEAALNNALTAAGLGDVAAAEAALTVAAEAVAAAEKSVNDIKNGTEYQQAEAMRVGYESKLETAKANLESIIASGTGNEEVIVNEETGEKKTRQQIAQEEWNQAAADLDAHQKSAVYQNLAAAEAALSAEQAKKSVVEAVVTANNDLNAARAAEDAAWKVYEAAGPDHTDTIEWYEWLIRVNEDYLNEQKALRAEKESRIAELLTQMSTESGLEAKLAEIQEQREKIAELKETSQGGDVTAPVSGTVQNIALTAGTTTITGEQLATILPDGTEYTMEVSVTREQAQRLSVGEIADIQNSWYYSNVTCVLQQIKTDKTDPAAKRILVFKVEGDVADGQSLSISIGQKSANYDNIVPNSAIREDNNGKFVLIVSQKSSPLGNRYYAERVDVEVLASDDTRSAITGDLNWDYIITTSTKPVEAGQLIRLAD